MAAGEKSPELWCLDRAPGMHRKRKCAVCVHGPMYGWMYMHIYIYTHVDIWMDRWIDRQIDRWIARCLYTATIPKKRMLIEQIRLESGFCWEASGVAHDSGYLDLKRMPSSSLLGHIPKGLGPLL